MSSPRIFQHSMGKLPWLMLPNIVSSWPCTNSYFTKILIQTWQTPICKHCSSGMQEWEMRKVYACCWKGGCQPQWQESRGLTPLHYTTEKGKLHIVNYLLSRDDIYSNACNNLGCIPLLVVSEFWQYQLVKLLEQREDDNPNTHGDEN